MTFLDPWFFGLTLAVPAGLVVLWRRTVPSVLFAPGELVADLPRSWRARLFVVPRVLQVAGLLCVVAALARPVERIPLPLTAPGIDIVLCLDTSSSMAANDMHTQRTRLDVAKEAAARFVAERRHDRVGIVAFARYPDLRCPPTLDHAAVTAFLSDVAMVGSDGPEDATGIGTAVARAAQVLANSDATSKVVVLLTDGEENVASARNPDEIAPLHAGQLCRELGVRVYAIAAGLGRRDPNGDWVELDTSQVRAVAERTGGRFFAARDARAIESVYAEIDALEKAALAEPRFRVEERFARFLAAALALLLLGRLLRVTVWRTLP